MKNIKDNKSEKTTTKNFTDLQNLLVAFQFKKYSTKIKK